ncbi:hypothetical protein [Cyanobium sp. Aljojuca 7A6]|uniref:hypothetical protein n=1 Tax=Cyanobium sp. Aljojuca 7A6 TaxID=2823697 RepID=UPI0020CD4ECB|nr:hypothetical protein [Cyanobium sp. Aljojuca 7A6]MCP9835103.1 hypothetical protein [Cyanobium sp. La Preciosa 7G6]MCP9937866.1 hypothetical protein [Cyanobium sp. Aljojuca 7A6]
MGPNLLAQALINQPRQDACQRLGIQGAFGFQLEICGDLPAVAFAEAPRVLALSVDGGTSVELAYQPQPASTVERLQQVLAPEVRGAVGHFDGLSPEGDALHGWAYRRGQRSGQPIEVWLHAAGQPPVKLRCDRYRPGMADQGYPEQCGFEIELHQLPPAWAGQEVQVCFDAGGKILLPGAGVVRLPGAGLGVIPSPAPLMHPASGSPYAAQVANAPGELQQSWQALEQFRQFLDGLEAQVCRAEEFQQLRGRQALETSGPLRKRDRLLRLLGLRS